MIFLNEDNFNILIKLVTLSGSFIKKITGDISTTLKSNFVKLLLLIFDFFSKWAHKVISQFVTNCVVAKCGN